MISRILGHVLTNATVCTAQAGPSLIQLHKKTSLDETPVQTDLILTQQGDRCCTKQARLCEGSLFLCDFLRGSKAGKARV